MPFQLPIHPFRYRRVLPYSWDVLLENVTGEIPYEFHC
jgi:hypothetical protein